MKKILFVFILLFLCVNIRVKGVEVNRDDYLKEIQQDVITIGVQNKDESLQDFKNSHFAKYLKNELNLKVKLKKVSEAEGINELLSQEIDFLENATLDDNSKIKYLNYNLLNNIIIISRNDFEFNLNQLSYKKVGIVDRKDIKNYPIELLSRNNNVKLYRNFNEMAKALENKEVDLGISDRKSRFEVLLYDNLNFVANEAKWKWKEGIASANPKYYKLIDIINENIYNKPNVVNDFFDNKDDCQKIIKKAFYKSLNNKEKEYIRKRKSINVIAKENSFPMLYKQDKVYQGVLSYFFNNFNKLTDMKINYILNNEKCNNDNDIIKENICYEKNKKVPNVIYKSTLSIACLNKDRLEFNSFDLVDKNKIGICQEFKLNKNDELLNNDVKYYKSFNDSLNAIKHKEVNFILMNKELFDYYQLKENDNTVIRFKDLDIPTIYYLSANNDVLSSILNKIYKVHYMETEVNKEKQWIVKDYMRKNYITALCKKKEFYKVLTIFSVGMLGVLIIFLFLGKKNIDKKKELNEKLDALLKKDSNLDIIEIDLKANKVKCNSGLIFSSNKKIDLKDYLNIMNLNIEDYLNEDKVNMINEAKKVLINGKNKYFKQSVYLSNNKKIISIITDITKEIREKIELQEKMKIDTLTGLINRDYYEEEIEKIVNQKSRFKGIFLYIDINDFKQFNDKLGHDFGDKVIKIIGNKLKSIVNEDTIAFRIAGDEFGVYKYDIETEDQGIRFLKELCDKLTIKESYNEFDIDISCSIGCAMAIENENSIGKLRNSAEAEMYKCKKRKCTKSIYKLAYSNENNKIK